MAGSINFTPAGVTVALSVGATATNATVTSLVPVRSYYVTNTGNYPIQLNFNPVSQPTAVFPTPGAPTLGPVIGSQDEVIVNIPAALTTATQGGSVYNIYISAISNQVTQGSIYITPVQTDPSFTY
jgi:hypothetical protein